jgi:hypothetical protein
MERNYDNRDFEQFLKQNADQYRMHPSEKVWTEINHTLHPQRRWYGIAALLLLLTGAVVSGVMILQPGSNSQIASPAIKINTQPVKEENKTVAKSSVPVLTNINPNRSIVSKRVPTIINNYSLESNVVAVMQDATIPQTVIVQEKNEKQIPSAINNKSDVASKTKNTISLSPVINNNVTENNNFVVINNKTEKNIPGLEELKPSVLISELLNKSKEGSNSFQKNKQKKKIIWQLYFTPGISYRRLTENKETILAASGGTSIPSNLALRDVRSLVTHKPDIGFELGLAAKYSITKNILFKAGFQFNVNKYNIHAFSYVAEPATIAIQGGSLPQSVTRTSYYRNFNGYNPNWLTNVYFSISVPVGFELNFINNKKISVGLGLTAQPTYLLDNSAYLISTDFKNYTKYPDLIRRWNMNTGAELIVGFKAGKTKFQIGPQMRYQAFSSFKDKYPVKENLFNFGLKAGVSLNK